MYSILQKLVSKRFYSTKEEAAGKANVFYACNVLTEEEYTNITILINEMYPDPNSQTEPMETA